MVKLKLNGTKEYSATVVKVPNIEPIENSDFLGVVTINGMSLVVRKDEVNVGDIMIYVANECQIDSDFLSFNNLYDFAHYDLNKNYKEVMNMPPDEAKKHCGFFAPNGRVRTIKLRGVQSFGILFNIATFESTYGLKKGDIDWDIYSGLPNNLNCFDTVIVDGKEHQFVKAYMPPMKPMKQQTHTPVKHICDKVLPGRFAFHYDTQPLGMSIGNINFDKHWTISVKMHGTSFIFANVQCKLPNKLAWWQKLSNTLHIKDYPKFRYDYSELYASRTVLKNRWADNPDETNNFNSGDVWAEYAKLLHGRIPGDITIYGEIVGYQTGSSTYIQKNYDYGCKPGTNKLMIYRMTYEDGLGNKKEAEASEVKAWTDDFIVNNKDIADRIMSLPILFDGDVKNRYNTSDKNVILKSLQVDKEFGMEQNEPMCKNKVPREGIVIRVDNDPLAEAFKLKCQKFLTRESKAIDAGEVDIELQQGKY